MDSSDEDLPESVLEVARTANLDLLPLKSRHRYEKEYILFENWCESKDVKIFKEAVFLAYFAEISKTCKPNTLWSRYSMLKSIIKLKKGVDLSNFFKVTTYLKKQNVGFRPKKAKIFLKNDIFKFINEAPDETYLHIKVAAIFGLAGACRREELAKMSLDHIEDKGNILLINIPDTKNHSFRSFAISEEAENGKLLNLFRKYASLRKPETPHKRFFVNYKKGNCTVQCIGINTIGKMPSEIAGYLKLPNPELYTGHSFRRSAATMLADSGEGITNIKRLGGWKSSSVAEGYIESSTNFQKELSNKILNFSAADAGPSTSQQLSPVQPSKMTSSSQVTPMATVATISAFTEALENQNPTFKSRSSLEKTLASAINLQNATNCTFNINVVNNN